MHLRSIKGLQLSLFLIVCATAQAQQPVIDKIVAKVDNEIILLSDVEFNYQDLASRGALVGKAPKCQVLKSLITQKMLLAVAKIDSVEVSDDQVKAQLDRRMQYFIAQSGGSADALEKYYGKSIGQIQDEMREDMRNQLVAQKMKENISEEVTITPSQVRKFFNRIPKDSLPFFSEEVEVAQIVKIARIGKNQKAKVKKQLEDIREQIMNGADFGEMAKTYSMDPGSASKGGELPGWYRRGELAPEYEAAIFKLKPGEISQPVETDFGFHLIQLIERRGNEFRTRHILISPSSSDLDIDYTTHQLDSVRSIIQEKKENFEKVASEFSDDKLSAPSGGFFLDNLGSSFVSVDQLDPTVYFTIDTMKLGEISPPMPFRMQDGKEAVRILYYKSKKPPHQANLKDDFQKIKDAALNERKAKAEAKWVKESRDKVYIQIDKDFEHCHLLDRL